MKTIRATADAPERLDTLTARLGNVTRSQAAKWIASGLCRLNGNICTKTGTKVAARDELVIDVPEAAEPTVQKEDIPLQILYQDADIAVVVKPCGMVVHPAAGNESGTMVNALLYLMNDLSGVGGVKRPGIVHRLDKDTSGLLLVAKNDAAHLSLSEQLRGRTMEKRYLAVVEGCMKEERGRVEQPIARSHQDRKKMAVDPKGRPAITEWELMENLRGAALMKVHILTGRTHQIRVHMRSIGHPVAGDPIYGYKKGVNVPRLMLHAYTLCFTHPITGERMCFTAPPPQAFTEAVRKLREDGAKALPYQTE